MRRSGTGVLALGLMVVAAAGSARGDDDEELQLADCPAAVRKTLTEEAKGARIEAISREQEEDGETTYWADVVIGGKTYGIGVTEDGTLSEISLQVDEDEVPLSECPAAVRKTFQEETRGAQVGGVGRKAKSGTTVYGAVVALGGKDYAVKVAEDGTLTEKTLVVVEDEVKLADCPAAVRKGLLDATGGGTIHEVTRSSGLVKRVYMAGVEIHNRSYVVEVAEDGSLISKAIDDGD